MSETGTALVETKKPSLTEIMAAEANLDRETYWATVKKTAMPANTSDEHVAAFLVLAHDMGLNPLSDEAHAFPSKGGVKLMVGVDGWVTIANKKKNYDGWEHEDNFDEKGNLVSVTAIIRRADHSLPTKITEYMDECKGTSEPWKKFPKRMLRHKAFRQGVRMAFGISNALDEEEARDMGYDPVTRTMKDVTPADPLQVAAAETEDQVSISDLSDQGKDSRKPEPVAIKNDSDFSDLSDQARKARARAIQSLPAESKEELRIFGDGINAAIAEVGKNVTKKLEEAKVSKTVSTQSGPVTLEVEGPSPMELAIKKINSYETVRNLQSYVKAKKALDWPGLFKPSEVDDLVRIADEKIAELKEVS